MAWARLSVSSTTSHSAMAVAARGPKAALKLPAASTTSSTNQPRRTFTARKNFRPGKLHNMKPRMNTEQPSRNQTICLAFSLRPSRLSGESAVRNNREDAKSAKNPRRRILSKWQRISTLVVQMTTDLRSSVVSGFTHHYRVYSNRRLCWPALDGVPGLQVVEDTE